ncbi:MAG: hypothetical protein KIS94_04475 [Chitinophagales bacterium]|nr:hypothetical protein [Chitinophagales bacterium]
MQLPSPLKARLEKSPQVTVAVFAALAAFCTYSCMYAFRKPFTAATYSGQTFAGIDLKILLVISQLIGYTLSKFLGIRYVSEMKHGYRAIGIIGLIAFAGLMLLLFALSTAPLNIFFMFLNGIPLGMVWGLVFSYIEGRRATEFMGSVLAISFIFSSGMVKSAGKWLMNDWQVSEFWMPFGTAALFFLPMAFFVFLLEQIPSPTKEDKNLRTERLPMSAKERSAFVKHFLPGIIVLVLTYVLLSIIRDFRDNFVADIWKELSENSAAIFTKTEVPISIAVLACMSMLMLVRSNFRALQINHYMVIAGFLLTGCSTYLYTHDTITAENWMILNGLGLYLGYIPFNVVFFERLIAAARKPANVGFLIYIADSFGYLGSIFILLFKNFGQAKMSYGNFFIQALYVASIAGAMLTLFSLFYFNRKLHSEKHV